MAAISPDKKDPASAEAEPTPPPARVATPRPLARYRAAALIGVLIAALGFAIAVQVHANSQSDSLSNLREDDLIVILDNQNARGDRLRQQIAELQQTLRRLQDSGDRNAAAVQQAEQDAAALGVLLGTLQASGPGVRVTIADPAHKLKPEDPARRHRGTAGGRRRGDPVRFGAGQHPERVHRGRRVHRARRDRAVGAVHGARHR